MMNKIKARNYPLVIVASIVILISFAILVLSIVYFRTFGWWAIVPIISSLSAIGLAEEAIRQNNPALLLLDLILPG